ncbi:MAG TPA: beta-lactamase family protein [Desulfuromonadales bacterium]|nr:beta-lactamase family protein [Desulfuromonadales bacterium]
MHTPYSLHTLRLRLRRLFYRVQNVSRTFPLCVIFCACLFVSNARYLYASDSLIDAGRATSIDLVLESAMRQGLIAGGVVVIGDRNGLQYSTARGRLFPAPEYPLLSDRTIFDIASLTKVIATTPAIMKLLEQGQINLLDPITRWFPEFEGTGREETTILNLLTHTSGINDIDIPVENPTAGALAKVALQNSGSLPGNRFRYADINFILLGELVTRVTGISLERFSSEQLFAPLAMADTLFRPPSDVPLSIAPTAGNSRVLQAGIVQDQNSRRLNGVAGHAGLFSSASDLSRFATMILNKGRSQTGAQLFSSRVIAQMTAPYFYSNGRIIRGLGWDIHSPFSSPRGVFFSEMSFGHTGYSGSSIWIDPDQDLFVILLTTRLDYVNIHHFNRLRSDISTLAVSIFGHPALVDEIITNPQIP